jgi:RNA polymerase sigma-70 factor, ECF subfamily
MSSLRPSKGDLRHGALTSAYTAYSRLVAHIGIRILGRHDEIDDLVQDVFVEAARWLPKIENRSLMKHWLITVTVRAAKHRLRKRGLRAILGLDDPAHDYGDISDHSASSAQKGVIRDVYRALDRIPVDDRLAWTLRYVEGESLVSVAEMTGCSLATVKRRVARAHSTVLEALNDGS